MLAQQRQAAIVARVRSDGGVRVADLVADFGVSDMTIRRDLEALAERGLLAKVHGGATLGAARARPTSRASRPSRCAQRPEKAAIAARAAAPGPARHRDRALGRHHHRRARPAPASTCPALTVVTNSVPVADVLLPGRPPRPDGGADRRRAHPVGRAGRPDRRGRASRTLHLDVLFLGVHGMSDRAGFTTPNLMEAETNRALVAAAGTAGRARRPHQVGHRRHLLDRRAGARPTCSITDSGLPDDARRDPARPNWSAS